MVGIGSGEVSRPVDGDEIENGIILFAAEVGIESEGVRWVSHDLSEECPSTVSFAVGF